MRRDSRRARARERWARRSLLVAAVAVVVAVAGVGAYLVIPGGPAARDAVRAAAADLPVLTPSPTATTLAPTPTTVVLPTPEPSPADAYAKVPIVQVGQISIPKINLTHSVYEGVWLTVVDKGPGHWPGTAMPGERGNSVFAGHRVTNTRPFRNVDQLEAGDEIVLQTAKGTFTYAVTGTEIVPPNALWIVDQSPDYTLTLFACHPPGSAAFRIVVYAKLVSPSA